MTTRKMIERAYRERERRILDAHARNVRPEQIALDEEISVARVFQILKEAREREQAARTQNPSLQLLSEIRAIRERIAQRAGQIDVLEALDRSRERSV